MTKLNVHEAKTHLSRYLKKVANGETIVLCKNGEPIAQIVPLPVKSRKGMLGFAKRMGKMTEKFFEPLTDEDLPGMGL